ncbi:GGDEF domain-containing protein [Pseudoxanthomonas sacheonensis]|uniref:GGDEF domain-containing protein n=1 Tax=Pseudoxanthomonas sacheonensis TaxID=443615 RepID=UPI0013D33CD2|nr:GGDEF domain-containing protein [Pseudoxanthomonas sacheonensis]KAF1709499.1 GGDEF domain-containing protein [Pseudoxanthomonas sacheonensis]
MNPVQTRRLTQEMADTYQRALTGGPFYAASWLLVGIYGNAFARAPVLSWGLLLAFIGLTVWRFLHRPLPEGSEVPAIARWLRLHWGIVLLTTALWGGLFCWATLDAGFGPARVTALLFTLGLATAIAHAFSMRRGFAFAGIALLCVPGLLLLWINPEDRPNGLMMVIYLVYVVISLLRSYAEYQQRLDLDQELRNQRDLFSRQSRIDALTELANRRQFADVLETAARQAWDSGQALSLLLLDIDHFKQINDTHGHAIGDACLMAIAARLKNSFNEPGDLAARVGGEEFGVVLQGQDLASAMQRAERFRAGLIEHPIAADGIVLNVTASIGIAEFDSSLHQDDDALYQAADSAIYRAKAAGRNRVCCDEPALASINHAL